MSVDLSKIDFKDEKEMNVPTPCINSYDFDNIEYLEDDSGVILHI